VAQSARRDAPYNKGVGDVLTGRRRFHNPGGQRRRRAHRRPVPRRPQTRVELAEHRDQSAPDLVEPSQDRGTDPVALVGGDGVGVGLFTPKRSLVRSQYRPPAQTPPPDLGRGRLTTGSDNAAGARPVRYRSPTATAVHFAGHMTSGRRTSSSRAAREQAEPWQRLVTLLGGVPGQIRRVGLGRRPIRIGNCARGSARGTPDRTPDGTSQR
jgi:hypothetical protein